MTDRLHSCKDSPDGKHHCEGTTVPWMCRYCHRTVAYLTDQGWRAPNDNAAEQLARRGEYNVIEGEHE